MNRMTRAHVRQMRAVGFALLLGAQPALGQSDSMPLPGGADASSFGHLAVDPLVWSIAASERHRAILTFDHYPDDREIGALEAAGLAVHSYRTLPMIIVHADGPGLRSLVGLRGLRSICLDRVLDDLTDDDVLGVAQFAASRAQTNESGRIALIDSRGPRLLASERRGARADRVAGARTSLNVVAALEGFEWVFENRLEHEIEIVANGWSVGGELAPTDPLSVALNVAHDAGLVIVFASDSERSEP